MSVDDVKKMPTLLDGETSQSVRDELVCLCFIAKRQSFLSFFKLNTQRRDTDKFAISPYRRDSCLKLLSPAFFFLFFMSSSTSLVTPRSKHFFQRNVFGLFFILSLFLDEFKKKKNKKINLMVRCPDKLEAYPHTLQHHRPYHIYISISRFLDSATFPILVGV